MSIYKESTFVYTWFNGATETIIAHFDNGTNSENLKNSFKECVNSYTLMSVKPKPKQNNEVYPYFISIKNGKIEKLVDPISKELIFFLV
jgi:hypothetical protein